MNKRLFLLLLMPLLATMLVGCGQKGPLYLPEAPAETAERTDADAS